MEEKFFVCFDTQGKRSAVWMIANSRKLTQRLVNMFGPDTNSLFRNRRQRLGIYGNRKLLFVGCPHHTMGVRHETWRKRLGKEEHLVKWKTPHIRGAGRASQLAMPRFITVREARVRIDQTGFRTRSMVIVTTLIDPIGYSKEDLANLYRARWNNELDRRTIKSVMQLWSDRELIPSFTECS